jgi:hypothetical protein
MGKSAAFDDALASFAMTYAKRLRSARESTQCRQATMRTAMSRAALRRARIPLFIVLAGLLLGVNNIPTDDESAKAKWSDVQNQYQRRAGLIPNLVEAGARSPAWPGALPSPRM